MEDYDIKKFVKSLVGISWEEVGQRLESELNIADTVYINNRGRKDYPIWRVSEYRDQLSDFMFFFTTAALPFRGKGNVMIFKDVIDHLVRIGAWEKEILANLE